MSAESRWTPPVGLETTESRWMTPEQFRRLIVMTTRKVCALEAKPERTPEEEDELAYNTWRLECFVRQE